MESFDELTRRIGELEEENKELRKWQESVNRLLNQMLDVVSHQGDVQKDLSSELQGLKEYSSINRYRLDSLPYELKDPDYELYFFNPSILSKSETIRKIKDEGKSIARLGDGEFAAIVGQKRWNFQDASDFLACKLKEVLKSDDDRLLIGLNPMFYMNLFDVQEDEADAVRAYMRPMVRKLHADLLDGNKIYGNALFHQIRNSEDVAELKKIWDRKYCVFVEGCQTRMGVGNDLFNNCAGIERILCPAENAIDRFDEIMNEVLKQPKDRLLLLALGPTATVLACELSKSGYQAVDIGHVDLIYEGFVRKAGDFNNVSIPYKYCKINEWERGHEIEDVDDPEYISQIVARID